MNGRVGNRDIPPMEAITALTIAEVASDTTPDSKQMRIEYPNIMQSGMYL